MACAAQGFSGRGGLPLAAIITPPKSMPPHRITTNQSSAKANERRTAMVRLFVIAVPEAWHGLPNFI
jgi:hypothetical protein